MARTLLCLMIPALGLGVAVAPAQPAAAAPTVGYAILPLSQSYVLAARGVYGQVTWSLTFLYPAGWALRTSPPGLYGAAPDLTRSGLGIFVTPERRGMTHFDFSQSPVLPGVADMRTAVGQYLSQRVPEAAVVQSVAFPPVVLSTTRLERLRLFYRGRPGGVPVEGMLTVSLGVYATAGAYYSNIVAEAFQIALDLPPSQLYTSLMGLHGIFRTLKGTSADPYTDKHPAYDLMKRLGGDPAWGIGPDGSQILLPTGAHDCWIKRTGSGQGEVLCGYKSSPGPGWEPVSG